MSTRRRIALRNARLISAEEVFAKARKSPAYRKAYDALDEEFSLVAAMIKVRTDAGRTRARSRST